MSEVREELAGAFVQLSDVLADDFDPARLLHALAERCVELLPVDTAGVLVAEPRGALRPSGVFPEPGTSTRLLELQTGAGPSVECYQANRALPNLDLHAERRRWPEFVSAALEAGFRSLHVLPLRLRQDVIGALNLFGVRAGPLPDADLRVGQALADVATIGILRQRRLRRAEQLATQLQGALSSRIVIEQAKGVLAERGRVDMDHAFQRLRGYARSHNRRLTDIAEAVVGGTMNADDVLR